MTRKEKGDYTNPVWERLRLSRDCHFLDEIVVLIGGP
jgi:hypothetical protein